VGEEWGGVGGGGGVRGELVVVGVGVRGGFGCVVGGFCKKTDIYKNKTS